MKKYWLIILGAIGWLVTLIVALLSDLSVYLYIGAMVAVTANLINIVLDNDIPALRYLQAYIRFLISELPATLQIITLSGYIAIIIKDSPTSAMNIATLVVALNGYYLTFKWRDYFDKHKLTPENKYDVQFRFYTLILAFALWPILYWASNQLLRQ